eukprot:767335-Hanusia_phi.AAC.10
MPAGGGAGRWRKLSLLASLSSLSELPPPGDLCTLHRLEATTDEPEGNKSGRGGAGGRRSTGETGRTRLTAGRGSGAEETRGAGETFGGPSSAVRG